MSPKAASCLAGAASLLMLSVAFADDPLPPRAYIEGVPFVSWHEMRAASFPGSDIVNPSLTAVAQMMYGYWGEDFVARAQGRTQPAGWESASGEGAPFETLKALLARGLPLEVAPATTPDAHRLYIVPKTCATLQNAPYTQPRPASGALGEMVPLQAVDELRKGGCETGLNDSVYLAAKLLIGYDDERQVLTMHDPSFGPNLEIGYDEFRRMWQATGAKYWAPHPQPLPALAAGRVEQVRARTADDEAAVALFRGYGLSVCGDHSQAERLLRAALALDGLSTGRRHLLHLELAIVLNETGRGLLAINELRLANAEFDAYAVTQQVLGRLLRTSGGGHDGKREARQIEARLKKLCGTEAQRAVADELGRDFHVMGCKGELLGWFRP